MNKTNLVYTYLIQSDLLGGSYLYTSYDSSFLFKALVIEIYTDTPDDNTFNVLKVKNGLSILFNYHE